MAEAAGRQRPVCPDCGFVYYHNPIPAVGILIDLEQPHLVPLYDIYSHLAYAVNKADVVTVIIEGCVVVKDRHLLTVDEPALFVKAREIASQIGPRFGLRDR